MHNYQHRAPWVGPGCSALDPTNVNLAGLAPPGAAGAAQSGLSPRSETQKAGCTRPSADQTKLNATIVGDSAGDSKAVATPSTLAAQFKFLGYSLHDLSDGSFLACRGGNSCPLQSRYEAQRFYRQIGGQV